MKLLKINCCRKLYLYKTDGLESKKKYFLSIIGTAFSTNLCVYLQCIGANVITNNVFKK